MYVTPWLSTLFQSFRGTGGSRYGAAKSATRPRRLQRMQAIEVLEERLLLSDMALTTANADAALNLYPGRQFQLDFALVGLTLADINGDGRADVVSAGDSLGVMLGNANSTFAPPILYPLADRARDMATGDVNEDGRLDVITICDLSPHSTVLLGQSDGTFQAGTSFVTIDYPDYVELGDLNNDGHLDIIVWRQSAESYSLYYGDGTGNFSRQPDQATQRGTSAVVINDLNHDGINDLILSNASATKASVFMGTGGGEFATEQILIIAGARANAIASRDVDGDGHQDILVGITDSIYGGPAVALLTGDGDGNFEETARVAIGDPVIIDFATSIITADLNGDSYLDLITANYSGSVSVALSAGNGTFLPSQSYFAGGSGVQVADVNGDGLSDLVSSGRDGAVTVLLGLGAGQFSGTNQGSSRFELPYGVLAGDLNKDGNLDRVVNYGSDQVAVEFGDGQGQFSAPAEMDLLHEYDSKNEALAVADVNQDGNLDIVVGYFLQAIFHNPPVCQIRVYEGDGFGHFAPPRIVPISITGLTNYGVTSVAVADVNGDGRNDLIASLLTGRVSVLLADSAGNFSATTDMIISAPFSVQSARLNGDDFVDLAIRTSDGTFYSLGNGTGGFSTPIRSGDSSLGMTARDFNRDGTTDLAVFSGNYPDFYLSILQADGHNRMVETGQFPIPYYIEALDSGDANGDGLIDLMAFGNSGNLFVLLGDGNGNFAATLTFAAQGGGTSAFMEVGDFNNDGRDDVTFTNKFTDSVPILFALDIKAAPANVDLLVSSVTATPDPLNVGASMQVQFTVKNQGTSQAAGAWTDGVYLSLDDHWDPTDYLLTRLVHRNGLAAGSEYLQSVLVTVPALAGIQPGEWHVVVRTDIRNEISETDRANNGVATPIELRLPVTPLTVGTATHGTIGADQALYFRVEQAAHQPLEFTLSGLPADGIVELYGLRDGLPAKFQFDYSGVVPFAAEQHFVFPSQTVASVIYLMVTVRTIATATTSFDLIANVPTFEVRDVYFGLAGNAGDFTLRAQGASLNDESLQVSLVSVGGTVIPAKALFLASFEEIYATFDLRGVAPGAYDVRFNNAFGQQQTVVHGLDILATQGAEITPHVIAPSRIRRGREFTFSVEWVNGSLNDMPIPLMTVGSTVPFGLAPRDYTLGTRYTFLGINTQGGPAGILRPGQRETITFWAYSDLEPGEYRVTVGRELKEPDALFDWSELQAELKPAELSDAEFLPIFEQVKSQVGPTNKDFLLALSRDASLLPPDLFDIRDVNDLLSHEISKAMAALTTSVAGKLTSADQSLSLAGLTVQLTPDARGSAFITHTLTDGTFLVSNLLPGTYQVAVLGLLVDAQSTTLTVADGQHSQGATVSVSTGEIVTGQVHSGDNSAIINASVQFFSVNRPAVSGQIGTDGSFRVTGLQTGEYTVAISAANFAELLLTHVSVSNSLTDLGNLLLTAGQTVQGTVRTFAGNAATNGVVNLQRLDSAGSMGQSVELQDGSFTFAHVAAGVYRLTVSVDGIIMAEINELAVTGAGAPIDVPPVSLLNTGSIAGTVELPEGQADFTNFRVSLFAADQNVSTGDVAADGTFELRGVPAGNYFLRLRSVPAGVLGGAVSISLAAGQNRTGVALIAAPASAVTGHVLSATGALPLTGVRVTLTDPAGNQSTVLSSIDGSYEFGNLEPGTYVLALSGTGLAASRKVTISTLGETIREQDFQIPVIAKLSGQVRIDGHAAAGATVQVLFDNRPVQVATADETGKATFLLLQPGVYHLHAFSPDGLFADVKEIQVNAGDDLSLDLQAGTATFSVLVQSATSVPLANAEVSLFGPGGAVLYGMTNQTGTVTFGHLLAGPYQISAVASDGRHQEINVELNTAQSGSATLTLLQEFRLAGILLGPAGTPVANGIVELLDSATSKVIDIAITDANGAYVFRSVATGDYVLSAYEEGAQRTSLHAIVNSADLTVNLMLDAATTFVTGRVSGDTEPIGGATVTVLGNDGLRLGSGTTAIDGTFEVTAISGQVLSVIISGIGTRAVKLGLPPLPAGVNPIGDITLEAVAIAVANAPVSQTETRLSNADLGSVLDTVGLEDFDLATADSAAVQFVSTFGIGDALSGIQNWFFDFLDWLSEPTPSPEHTEMPAPITDPCKLEHCGELFVKLVKAVGAQTKEFQEVENSSRQLTGIVGEKYARITKLIADGVALVTTFALLTEYVSALAVAEASILGYTGAGVPAAQFGLSVIRALVDAKNTAASYQGISGPADAIAIGLQGSGAAATLLAGAADTYSEANETYTKALIAFYKEKKYWEYWDPQRAAFMEEPPKVTAFRSFLTRTAAVLGAVSYVADVYNDLSTNLVVLGTQLEQIEKQYETDYGQYERAARIAHVLEARLNACLAEPCDEDGEEDEEKKIDRPVSFDPNDIIGPAAVGPNNHLLPDTVMPYTIRFENHAVLAAAPAASVIVTQTLDSDLDWTTFRLGSIGFGDVVINVPADTAFFETRYDLTATRGVFVDIRAGINIATGQVRWEFTAIDPATGDLPADPLVGFLPPNVHGPEGEGFLNYSIRPKSTVVTGTRIDAVASITFDVNEPIVTPSIFHTFDAGSPTSRVSVLPTTLNTPQFTVTWFGTDEPQGSGIETYDVFVAVDGGPFTLFLDDTALTSATFTGLPLHTYAFYSVATDRVGHAEAVPTIADTVVSIQPGLLIAVDTAPVSYVAKAKPPAVVGATATITFGGNSPNVNGARLVASLSSNRDKKDILGLAGGGAAGITVKGKNVLFRSTVIGTVSGGKKKIPDLTVEFNASATLEIVQAVLRSITFSTKAVGSGPRTLQLRLTNVGGMNSNTVTRQVAVS